jgi:ABC-type transport system involved in multi-copper enzyme maturation permease subunit
VIPRDSWLAGFWRGVALGTRGLVSKEIRSRSRGWRPAILLTGYLVALMVGVTGFLFLFGEANGMVPPSIGVHLFSMLSLGAVLLLSFITPALTAAAVSGERERRTLDLLLVTRASPLGLVTGKLLGSLVYILFLLVASLPAFALVYLFGGVPPRYLIMVMAVATVTALAHAALGLLFSAVFKRTLVALVLSYIVVLGLVIGIPIVSAVVGISGRVTGWDLMTGPATSAVVRVEPLLPPGIVLHATPLLSLSSVLPSGPADSSMVGSILRQVLYGPNPFPIQSPALPMTRSLYVIGRDFTSGQAQTAVYWAPWVYHFVFSIVFSLISLLVSALVLAPVKPWQSWRAHRQARAVSVGTSPT